MARGDKLMTTSCCSAYVRAVQKHVPELIPCVSETRSPMHYTAELAKQKEPDCITVFIGPCLAKRREGMDDECVDREPLVRVLVKNFNGDVVLDGYILVHIARVAPDAPSADNLEVDNYPAYDAEFDLCNVATVFGQTTWGQFSNLVLQTKLDNMTKEDFDAQYEPDLKRSIPVDRDANNNPVYVMSIYGDYAANGSAGAAAIPEHMITPTATQQLGTMACETGDVFYYGNSYFRPQTASLP